VSIDKGSSGYVSLYKFRQVISDYNMLVQVSSGFDML